MNSLVDRFCILMLLVDRVLGFCAKNITNSFCLSANLARESNPRLLIVGFMLAEEDVGVL